jgi:hypothetical protein
LLLILASFVVLSSLILFVVSEQALRELVSLAGADTNRSAYLFYGARILIWGLLCLLFFMPLGYSLLYLAAGITSGRESALIDVLYAFGGRREYHRAFRLGFGVMWKIAILLAVVKGTQYAFAELAYWMRWQESFGMTALFILTLTLELFLFFCLCERRFFVPFFMVYRGLSHKDAVAMSKKMTGCCHLSAVRYTLDYLPWILLSFFTVGVLFFADTLPRMLVSYFDFCQSTYEMIIQSEE